MTPTIGIDPADRLDRAAVLALNNAHAAETSELDAVDLQAMLAGSFHAAGIEGGAAAFLLAFDQDADYASPNFLWFRERFPRFVYVDRVVIAPVARGRGHARALYADLFARGAAAAHDIVACEVNLEPPNPASDAFHGALAFEEVGRGDVGVKRVRYLVRRLAR